MFVLGSLVRDLYNELKDAVADKWYLIGVQLGVPVPKLNGIQKKNNDDVSLCLIALLQYWIDSSNPAKPWDDVIAALRKVDNNKLADELKSKPAADSKGIRITTTKINDHCFTYTLYSDERCCV